MRSIEIPSEALREMKAHARDAYPDECCGFLIASADGDHGSRSRRIDAVERARNDVQGARRHRFAIRPEELRRIERRTENLGRQVVGFYHSHPDRPARPSELDREHAWPWYSYLILSVTAADVPALAAFELDPVAPEFHEVTWSSAADGRAHGPGPRGSERVRT